MNVKLAMAAGALILGTAVALPVSGQAMTAQGVADCYGRPVAVAKAENGTELRTYKQSVGMGAEIYRVFSVNGGQVVDLGVQFTSDTPAASRTLEISGK